MSIPPSAVDTGGHTMYTLPCSSSTLYNLKFASSQGFSSFFRRFSNGLYRRENGSGFWESPPPPCDTMTREGLLPFVERSPGRRPNVPGFGRRMAAGHRLHEAGRHVDHATSGNTSKWPLQGDDTIELAPGAVSPPAGTQWSRADGRAVPRDAQMVEYKCWYYETAKAAGSMSALKEMKESDIPERFRRIRGELRGAARPPEEGQVVPPEVFAYRLSRPGS